MTHSSRYAVVQMVLVGWLCTSTGLANRIRAERTFASTPTKSFESKHWREAQSCGVACGYMLARLLGKDVDYPQAVAAIPIESGGTSLLSLQRGLGAMGVPTSILKAKPTELDRIAMPVITHMLPRQETAGSVGHFLLVLQIDDHFVRYIEPNYAASIETVPRNQFLRCWSGYLVAADSQRVAREHWLDVGLWGAFAASISIGAYCAARSFCRCIPTIRRVLAFLLFGLVTCGLTAGCSSGPPALGRTVNVAERRRQPADGCRLVAWNTEVDLGVMPQGGSAEASFRIENQGDSAVRLQLGTPTCRCSEAKIDRETLQPGESADVRMRMRATSRQAGPADARVYLAAQGCKWAEMLSVHGVELGAVVPPYRYIVGGPAPARAASVVATLFLKDPTTPAKIDTTLKGTGLDRLLLVRDVRIGPPIAMTGCVRRECSFTAALKANAEAVAERLEVMLPITITLGAERSQHEISLTVLPPNVPPRPEAGGSL
jgi:hypothetical protein